MTQWSNRRLETALTDLALELETPDQVAQVRERLDAAPPASRARRLVLAGAALTLVAALVVAIPDSRHVAADWLGIGATSVETVDELPEITPTTSTTPGAETGSTGGDPRTQLADAGYPDLLPNGLPAPSDRLTIDDREARLGWGDVELTIRPLGDDTALNRKFATADQAVERVDLADGTAALWVPPGHVILRGTTASVADGVLLWVAQEHEYRLEGAVDLATAVALADSMG